MPGLLKLVVKDSQIICQSVSSPQCRGRVPVAGVLEACLHCFGPLAENVFSV